MLTSSLHIRPRYGEVDSMGYLYHARYVDYCHEVRTALFRTMGIHDSVLDANNVLLPVIKMELQYHQPSFYDEVLTVTATLLELPLTRCKMRFTFTNGQGEKVCSAYSEIAFADKETRSAIRAPEFVLQKILPVWEKQMAKKTHHAD